MMILHVFVLTTAAGVTVAAAARVDGGAGLIAEVDERTLDAAEPPDAEPAGGGFGWNWT